jgi:hypothetical protein
MDKKLRASAADPVALALGRLFAIMSRPYEPGDDDTYMACRAIVLDATEPVPDYRPNWAKQRLGGAAGD